MLNEGKAYQRINQGPTPHVSYEESKYPDRTRITLVRSLYLHISQCAKTIFDKLSEILNVDSSMGIFFKYGSRLNQSAIHHYIDALQVDDKANFELTFIHKAGSVELDDAKKTLESAIESATREKKQFLSIPIVVKGTLTEHITHLLIEFDYKEKKALVEFFDSFGYAPKDYKRGEISLEEYMSTVQGLLTSAKFETKRFEHTKIVQNDKHNCGIHVLNHLNNRIVQNYTPASFSKFEEKMESICNIRFSQGRTIMKRNTENEIVSVGIPKNDADDF